MHRPPNALLAHPQLPEILKVVLHAAVRRVPVVCLAPPLRFRTRRQRRESESRTVPTCRGHQDSAGILPGRLLRAHLGTPARSSREAPGPALTSLDQSAAALARPAGDV